MIFKKGVFLQYKGVLIKISRGCAPDPHYHALEKLATRLQLPHSKISSGAPVLSLLPLLAESYSIIIWRTLRYREPSAWTFNGNSILLQPFRRVERENDPLQLVFSPHYLIWAPATMMPYCCNVCMSHLCIYYETRDIDNLIRLRAREGWIKLPTVHWCFRMTEHFSYKMGKIKYCWEIVKQEPRQKT